jgi:hypothetical protein
LTSKRDRGNAGVPAPPPAPPPPPSPPYSNENDDGGNDDYYYEDNGFGLSEVDELILEYNQQGLTAPKISSALKENDRIILSTRSVLRHLEELRQDPDNDVQINYAATYRKPKSEQKWYNVIAILQKEIPAYTARTGFKPSSRTMFYQLQDLHKVKPTDINAYSHATVLARLGWKDANGELIYPKLDIDCFSDDSRKTIDAYDDSEPTEMLEPGEIQDPDVYIENAIEYLKRAPLRYDGVAEPGIDGKAGGRWYDQPEYVEVWEEKVDLVDAFDVLLEGRCVNIRANKGYASLVFLYKCTQELKQLIEEKGLELEHVHIKYFGDWDPSGIDIDRYIKYRLKELGLEGIDFQRVAVLPHQIDKYKLPLMPVEQSENKSRPNPNMSEFKRKYGNKATHLNAFFTKKHLPVFRDEILIPSVDKHFDQEIYDDMVEEYEVEAPAPESLSEEELEEARAEMRELITEAFKPGWENENDEEDDDDEDNE